MLGAHVTNLDYGDQAVDAELEDKLEHYQSSLVTAPWTNAIFAVLPPGKAGVGTAVNDVPGGTVGWRLSPTRTPAGTSCKHLNRCRTRLGIH